MQMRTKVVWTIVRVEVVEVVVIWIFFEIETPRVNIIFNFSLMIIKFHSFYNHYLESYKRLLLLIDDLVTLGYLSSKNGRINT